MQLAMLFVGMVCFLNLYSGPPVFERPVLLGTESETLTPDLPALADRAVNRKATVLVEGERRGIRFNEAEGQGLIWVPEVRFATGVIRVQVRGKDVFQRSFVGIAFNGDNGSKYELVYLRPFNFRAKDPVRRSHAIQYAAHPDWPWPKLRSERTGEFEKGVAQEHDPTAWLDLRLEVSADRVRAFIGNDSSPALDVPRLSKGGGMVGLWVGTQSGGDFANLRITL